MSIMNKEVPREQIKDIFEIIGSYGPWQRTVFLIFFAVNTFGIWQNFAMTFLAPNMEYWCVEPKVENYTVFQRLHFASANNKSILENNLNLTMKQKDQCEVKIYTIQNSSDSATYVKRVTKPCTKWEYDTSFFSETLVSEWDLVCSREWLISLAKSIYMIGFLVSVFTLGQISDCIGRLPSIIIAYFITVISQLLSLFSTSYVMFAILRFFQAFGRTGVTTNGFVLVMELIGAKHRTEVGIGIQLGWTMGFILLPGIGWFFRHWFWFQLAIFIPILFLAAFYKYIPESPRWLMMQRKTEKLEKLLTKAAKVNGRDLHYDIKETKLFKSFDEAKLEIKNRKTIFDLLKTSRMRKRAINMAYLWFVNAFMYYGLSFNTNDLGGNSYLNFFIAGVLEIPSYVLLYFGIKYWGRRPILILLMLVAGATYAALMPVPSHLEWLVITLSMVGKFCITGSFGLLYLYTSEVFPTVVRNVAIGSCSMCARIGSIIAPFVRELARATHPAVPNALYTILAISSGLFAFLLPETKDFQIPDTLEEGEHFGEGKSEEMKNFDNQNHK